MKAILFLLWVCLSPFFVFSQCLPTAPTGVPGITPPPAAVPCIERGVFYNTVMQFENFTFIATPFGSATMNFARIDSIKNFPCGIGWRASKLNFAPGETGCIEVSGTTSDAAGQYPLEIYMTVSITVFGQTFQQSGELATLVAQFQNGLGVNLNVNTGYHSRVINAGASCPAIDLSGTAVNLQNPVHCHDGDHCTDDLCINGACQFLQIPGCCTPAAPTGTPGFTAPDLVPCIEKGVFYSSTIQFENLTTISDNVTVLPVNFVRIDSIKNLPCGMSWHASKLTFGPGETGCIKISGITTEAAGQYPLEIYVTMSIIVFGTPNEASGEFSELLSELESFLGSIDVNVDAYLRVIEPATSCPPVDTTDTAINLQNPVHCHDGDPCTDDLCVNGSCQFPQIPGCCTPDHSFTELGIYPPAGGLVSGCEGDDYLESLTVVIPGRLTLQGFTFPITEAVVTSVTGLPPGLSFSCSTPTCAYPGATTGCLFLSGIPAEGGTFPVSATLQIEIFIGGLSFKTDMTFALGEIFIREKDCAGVCDGNAFVDDCGICINGVQTVHPLCDDGDLCTINFCTNPGVCNTVFLFFCADNDLCTDDICEDGVCLHPLRSCDDGDLCTVDNCLFGGGIDTVIFDPCTHILIDCDDNEPCTEDLCDGGECIFTHIPGCCTPDASQTEFGVFPPSGGFPQGCEDEFYQSSVTVVTQNFQQLPFDVIEVTIDFIEGLPPGMSVVCSNANCVLPGEFQGETIGCFSIEGTPGTGGVFSLTAHITVRVELLGTLSTTIPLGTLTIIQRDCAGVCGGSAFVDDCGICINGVQTVHPLCDDDDLCTINFCTSPGVCNTVFLFFCADNDLCTDDICEDGVCLHPLRSCDDGDLCTVDNCLFGGGIDTVIFDPCTHILIDCDDNESCTEDLCDGGECIFTHIPGCCTPDASQTEFGVFPPAGGFPQGCEDEFYQSSITVVTQNFPFPSLDFVDITIDSVEGLPPGVAIACGDPSCIFQGETIGCFSIEGTPVMGGVFSLKAHVTVRAEILSTMFISSSIVDLGTLTIIQKDCAGACGGSALVDACGVCVTATTIHPVCNDDDPCTRDVCFGPGICTHASVLCDDNEPCTIDFCDNGICFFENSPACCLDASLDFTTNCTDNNACTDDFCSNEQCSHLPVSCDDGNPCTIDECFALDTVILPGGGVFGGGSCLHTPVSCDDNDTCTIDQCTVDSTSRFFTSTCLNIPIPGCPGVCTEAVLIEEIPIPSYCQGNKVYLKAVVANAVSFLWSTGETTSVIEADAGTSYSVTAVLANGCQPSATHTTTELSELNSSYVILAHKAITLTNSKVFSGGVGVINTFGRAKVLLNSEVTAPSTFVKADIIQIAGSNVAVQIPSEADVTPPPFEFNPFCGTGQNINVPANATVTLSGSQYKGISIGKNSTVTFTQAHIDIENLFTKENVTIRFAAPCVKLRICNKMQLGVNSVFNPDEADIVVFPEIDVTVNAGSTVIADIHMNTGKMKVLSATQNAPTVMTGLFIVNMLDAGEFTEWHQNERCDAVCNGQQIECLGSEREVTSFTLVNADTDADIGTLTNGAVIDRTITGPVAIRANVCHEDNVESVEFLLNGILNNIENIPFYTIAGDNNGDYSPWSVPPGVYTIKAIPYSADNATGTPGIPHEVTITIVGSAAKMDAGEQSFTPDATIQLKAYPNPFKDILNIEFSLPEEGEVKLEVFNMAGQQMAVLFEGNVMANEIRKIEYFAGNVSEGIIIYRLQTPKGMIYGKGVLVR